MLINKTSKKIYFILKSGGNTDPFFTIQLFLPYQDYNICVLGFCCGTFSVLALRYFGQVLDYNELIMLAL